MTIEKLKSGNYRVKQMKDGKYYSAMFEYKPSKREAEEAIRKVIEEKSKRVNGHTTFRAAVDQYISMKENVLSPSTIRDYSRMCNRLSDWFCDTEIDDITQVTINLQVNEWAARLSPKTVRNYHGFISTILGTFRPDFNIHTKLPQKHKSEPYTPSDDEVKKILVELAGKECYVPLILASFGMRRSEILALTLDDIEGNIVHITKAMVFNKENKLVVKSTKTTDSKRDIIIPMEIADMIREKGYVYKGDPSNINDNLIKVEERLGIQHFSLHKLRHYFASKMLTLTDAETVQALGGWKTDHVMKNVYAHAMKDEKEKAKRLAAEKLGKSIF